MLKINPIVRNRQYSSSNNITAEQKSNITQKPDVVSFKGKQETTIDFKLTKADRSPAFKFNIEGDLSDNDVENIKKLLINKGRMKNLIENGNYQNIIEAMQEIVDYLNK